MSTFGKTFLIIVLIGLFAVRFFFAEGISADMLDFISGIITGITAGVVLFLMRK